MFRRFVLLALLFPGISRSVESFNGYILQKGSIRILKTADNNYKPLVASTVEVKTQLEKLKNNDFLAGIGNMTRANSIEVETIDFVGLNEFLGIWISPSGFIRVQDFSNLNMVTGTNQSLVRSTNLNYSITPKDGEGWVMFLTDAQQIYYSTLDITQTKASIKIIDPQTGSIKNQLYISKISNQ